jgi:hypothetical protein
MKRHTNIKAARSGKVLVLVLFAIALMLMISAGLSSLDLHIRTWASSISNEIASRTAADAGLEKAIALMNSKLKSRTWDDDDLPASIFECLPNCDAKFSYATEINKNGDYIVTSAGTSGRALRTVTAVMGLQGLFEYAMLVEHDLIMKPNTSISGYNSVDANDTDADMEIATADTDAGSIVLDSTVTVAGDIAVGVGGDPSTVIEDNGATIEGISYSMYVPPPLPEIKPEPLPSMGTALTLSSASKTISPMDNGQYTGLTLSGGATTVLHISGGEVVLHIAGDITLGVDTSVLVDAGSTLKLYVDGDIVTNVGSGFDSGGDPRQPENLQIYGTGTDQFFDLKAKSNWSGVIYAPNADIVLRAKGDFFGSVIADTLEFKSGGNFYYDEALRQVAVEDVGVRFVLRRWYEQSRSLALNNEMTY